MMSKKFSDTTFDALKAAKLQHCPVWQCQQKACGSPLDQTWGHTLTVPITIPKQTNLVGDFDHQP